MTRQQTLNDVVEANGIGAEKAFLYQHPEFLQTEEGITRLRGAAMNAMSRGHARGTDALVADVQQQLFGTSQSADQRPQTGRVTLSADQRQFYGRLGLSDKQAAREVLKLQRLKQQGHYQNEG